MERGELIDSLVRKLPAASRFNDRGSFIEQAPSPTAPQRAPSSRAGAKDSSNGGAGGGNVDVTLSRSPTRMASGSTAAGTEELYGLSLRLAGSGSVGAAQQQQLYQVGSAGQHSTASSFDFNRCVLLGDWGALRPTALLCAVRLASAERAAGTPRRQG